MNNSQILPWHETPSSPRSVFQDGVALSFLSRCTSCVEGTVLSRGGPMGFCLGRIITYTSASHPLSFSCPLKRSLLSSLSYLGLSGSTAHPAVVPLRSQAAVPLRSDSTARGSTTVVSLGAWHLRVVLSIFERFLLSRARAPAVVPHCLRYYGRRVTSGSIAPQRYYRP